MNENNTPITEETEGVIAPEETPAPVTEEEPKLVEIVGVGFRSAGKTYYFSPKTFKLKVGDPVIVETARGVEMGKITIANRMVSESEIVPPLRQIIRPANESDITRHEENRRLEQRAAEICRQKIENHKLEMDLVSVEYTFDNSKLLFYFTAENRVDFRELVKDLASVFKTRIELRQIGIRDEAKMMGGFGVCGRPFCCSTFLSDFVQVSIKMAKEQNFSLNSAKISGACGRLMCCLRYEHDVYEEAVAKTPSSGSYVSTPNGLGTVVETRPLAGMVSVKLEDKAEAPRLYAVADIKVLRSKGKTGLQPDATPDAAAEEAPAEKPAAPESQPAEEKQNEPKAEGGNERKKNNNFRRGKHHGKGGKGHHRPNSDRAENKSKPQGNRNGDQNKGDH